MDQPPDFAVLFKGMPATCVVLNRDLRFVAASDAYLKTIDMTQDQLIGQYVFDLFPESDERREMFQNAFDRTLAGEANDVVNVPYRIPDPSKGPDAMREVWWTCRHMPIRDADGQVTHIVQHANDVTRQFHAEQLKNAVVAEMQHRVGNILGMVNVIARRTANLAVDLDEFIDKFSGRIKALSRTYGFLTGSDWQALTLDKIVARQIDELVSFPDTQIEAGGGQIMLNAKEAQIMTLAIHELATNSVKYGALHRPGGALSIRWEPMGDGGFQFEWDEQGLEPSPDLKTKGFGTVILQEIVPAQLRGETVRKMDGGHFSYHLTVPNRSNHA